MLDGATLEGTELDIDELEELNGAELDGIELEDTELESELLLTAWLDTELTVEDDNALDDELDLLPSPPHATNVKASAVSVAS